MHPQKLLLYNLHDMGWEFAHRFSEQIALFFAKKLANNEQISNSLKKVSDLLICSFLVSDLSDSLMFAH